MISRLSSSSGGIRTAVARERHHLSDRLHHHRDSKSSPVENQFLYPRGLDEWRQGGTAHLSIADSERMEDITSNQRAWWEDGTAESSKKPGGTTSTTRREPQTFYDGHEETNGEHPSLRSYQAKPFVSRSTHSRNKSELYHARVYKGNDEDPTKDLNHKFWLRTRAPRLEDPLLSFTDMYSYSCPQLSEHDIFHPNHICKPYVSKELTRSMRFIRLRVVPSPASFNPPLYLKCGPLLRYTGLRRDRVRNSRSDQILERETWRGSVMIVTTDSDSSYNPVPVLHIFHEPMNLLPPPPHGMDNESIQSLPSEYVDPIAGLPKLSRTGKAIYVKPVEDLEHEVDLSRVEDDGGLFEETRTAAVPTSYGQPGNQSSRGLPSSSGDSKARLLGGQPRMGSQQVKGIRLHAERGVTFWRFNIEVELGDKQARVAYRINKSASVGFWVPARGESMNVMFHTCNGFSMNVE